MVEINKIVNWNKCNEKAITQAEKLIGESLSPTEIKASGGLQECEEEDVSKADAHSATRTLERS